MSKGSNNKSARSKTGNILLEKQATGGPQSGEKGPSAAQLEQERLRKELQQVVTQVQQLKNPNDALPNELTAITQERRKIDDVASQDRLSAGDVQTARDGIELVRQAIAAADKVVQTRLKQEAAHVVAQVQLLKNPNDALPNELTAITQERRKIDDVANQDRLSAGDVQKARDGIELVRQAIADADKIVQARLKQEATDVVTQVQQLKDPDGALPNELTGVRQERQKIDDIAGKARLAASDVQSARDTIDLVRQAIAAADIVVQARLKQEVSDVVTQVKELKDPADALKDELTAVKQERQKIDDIAGKARLSPGDVQIAKDGINLVQQAIAAAAQAVQTRLRREIQDIVAEVTNSPVWSQPNLDLQEARNDEAKLTAVANKVTLTPKDVVAARELAADVQAELSLAQMAVVAQLRQERAQIIAEVNGPSFKKPAGAEDSEWTGVVRVVDEVKQILRTTPLVQQVLDDARNKVLEAKTAVTQATDAIRVRLNQLRDQAIAAKKDSQVEGRKVLGEATKKLSDAIKEFKLPNDVRDQVLAVLRQDATYQAFNSLGTKEVANGIDAFRAELDAAIEAVAQRAKALAATAQSHGANPNLGDALATTQRGLDLAVGYDRLCAYARAEGALTSESIKKAREKYVFSSATPEAQEQLNSLATKLGYLEKSLTELTAKDWPKSTFVKKIVSKESFTVEEADNAQEFIGVRWRKAVDELRKQREGYDLELKQTLETYQSVAANQSRAATEVEWLGVLLDALKNGLSSKVAAAKRADLTQGAKSYPLATWKAVLQRELDEQLNTPWKGERWASLFGMGTIGENNSWGIDKAGTFGGYNCHITYYPSEKEAAPSESQQNILNKILTTGAGAVHCTQERFGKENTSNPKYYRGGTVIPNHYGSDQPLVNGLKKILDDYEQTWAATVAGVIQRFGLDEVQTKARRDYLKQVMGELRGKLTS